MKILIVIPSIGSVYGGPSKIAVELAQSLGHLGVEVDLVTTNSNGETRLNVELNTWIYEANYRTQYFDFWYAKDYKISISLSKWLFKNIKNYDLVHTISVFSYMTTIAHWACQIHNIPYVMNPQGMLEPWALSYKSHKKRLYYYLIEKPALDRASAIQMLSLAEAEPIEKLNIKAPLVIIPNGIHAEQFENQLDLDPESFYQTFPNTRDRTLILFLARIDPKKGLDLLASAFTKVHTLFPQTHLIIAGPDNIGFLPTAQHYFSEAGCLSSVTFTGMLTGELKYAALAVANIYIAPSYSEGFSMSVLEGMAAGLPCVITIGCNFPEAATARAAYVVNIDSQEISHALIQCLKNPKEAKIMGECARKLVFNKYTWDRIALQLIELYKSIIFK
jgi:glycosyltransferase involved in cell wall biosynthesis